MKVCAIESRRLKECVKSITGESGRHDVSLSLEARMIEMYEKNGAGRMW